ncbi:MAG TPA: tetratricopeptide repeat protein, partial [Candidatus Polarisedimenticolaceae bacterium]|nr:tetratricopeptide repeat protein [Candidatus Polarisedimenticolaceae bacterium]
EVPSGGPLGSQAPRWHRAEGVLMLWGRAVRPGQTLPQATLYDVLPTVLRLLDLPLAKTLRGHPLEAALLPDALPAPVAAVPDYEMNGARAKRTAPLDPAEVSARLAALRALGDSGPMAPPVPGGAPKEVLRRFNEAIALLEAKKPEAALASMRALQQEMPDAPLGWYGEGMVHLAQNAPAAAIPPLERAVRSGPKLGAAQALLGEAYARAGRLDEALRACREAVRLEPRNPKPALLAGSLLMARQRIDEAEPFFQAALEATPAGSPEHARALVGLGVIAHGRKRPEDAHARFQEALAQSPEQPGALEGLAVLALERGEVGEALQMSERLVRVSGEDPRALTLQARALVAAGRKPEAAGVLRRAIAIRPDPEAQRMLSQLGAAP